MKRKEKFRTNVSTAVPEPDKKYVHTSNQCLHLCTPINHENMVSYIQLLIALACVPTSLADETCVPQAIPYPISCVDCATSLNPQNLPLDQNKNIDVSKLWGTWFTIASEYNATDRTSTANVCTQLVFSPKDPYNNLTDLSYLAAYNKNQEPWGPSAAAQALLSPTSTDFPLGSPPYQFHIPVSNPQTQDFFFAATDGDENGDGITAVVTYVCPKDGKNS